MTIWTGGIVYYAQFPDFYCDIYSDILVAFIPVQSD